MTTGSPTRSRSATTATYSRQWGWACSPSGARRVTDTMFMAAAMALRDDLSPSVLAGGDPRSAAVTDHSTMVRTPTASEIACAVGKQAQADGVAPQTSGQDKLERQLVDETMWLAGVPEMIPSLTGLAKKSVNHVDIDTRPSASISRRRMQEVGTRHYFAVPGDYNLVLLDELLRNRDDLQMISCCNELNAVVRCRRILPGHRRARQRWWSHSVSAGSARSTASPGAYAESLPVHSHLSGGPNTNSEAENEFLHHTHRRGRLRLSARDVRAGDRRVGHHPDARRRSAGPDRPRHREWRLLRPQAGVYRGTLQSCRPPRRRHPERALLRCANVVQSTT